MVKCKGAIFSAGIADSVKARKKNNGTKRETPSIGLGICEFQVYYVYHCCLYFISLKLLLEVLETEICFPRRPQTYLEACRCHL